VGQTFEKKIAKFTANSRHQFPVTLYLKNTKNTCQTEKYKFMLLDGCQKIPNLTYLALQNAS